MLLLWFEHILPRINSKVRDENILMDLKIGFHFFDPLLQRVKRNLGLFTRLWLAFFGPRPRTSQRDSSDDLSYSPPYGSIQKAPYRLQQGPNDDSDEVFPFQVLYHLTSEYAVCFVDSAPTTTWPIWTGDNLRSLDNHTELHWTPGGVEDLDLLFAGYTFPLGTTKVLGILWYLVLSTSL